MEIREEQRQCQIDNLGKFLSRMITGKTLPSAKFHHQNKEEMLSAETVQCVNRKEPESFNSWVVEMEKDQGMSNENIPVASLKDFVDPEVLKIIFKVFLLRMDEKLYDNLKNLINLRISEAIKKLGEYHFLQQALAERHEFLRRIKSTKLVLKGCFGKIVGQKY